MPKYSDELDLRLELPIIIVVDTSSSMAGPHMVQLNYALQELNRELESLADEKEVRLSIRLIEFNTTARWVIGNTNNSVEHLDVYFSEASGLTNTGEALRLARSVMYRRYLQLARVLKPIVFLFTDGESIGPRETSDAINELKSAFGRRDIILRIAFEIGNEWIPELEVFASQGEDEPLIFKVDDLGHIQDVDMFRSILFQWITFGYPDVVPYDDAFFPDDIECDDNEGDWIE